MKLSKRITLISVATLMGLTATTSYLNAPQSVQATTYPKRTIQFKNNSYLYNKNSKRLTKYNGKTAFFKKNSKLKAPIQTSSSKTHYYFKDKNKTIYLKTTTINKKPYFYLGSGAYIYAGDVLTVNGSLIFTDLNVKVKVTKDIHTVDSQAQKNNKVIKKGTIITANGLGSLPNGGWIDSGVPVEYYHIAGTKEYLDSQYTKLLSPVQNGNEFTNLYQAQAYPKFSSNESENGVAYYSIDGKEAYPGMSTAPYQKFNLLGAIYLWDQNSNKPELFYYVNNGSNKVYVYDSQTKQQAKTPTGPLFVKADSVKLSQGSAPKVINTPSEAAAGISTASATQKNDLQTELAKVNSVKSSTQYKNAGRTTKENYDTAVTIAEKIANNSTSNGNEVTFAIWLLKQNTPDTKAQKVKVAYPYFLSAYDRAKILNAAKKEYGLSTEWANHNRQLITITYSNSQGSQIASVKKLNINNFVQVATPKIKNKKGYDSSATQEAIDKNKTLAKYAKMLNYNMRTSALVANKNTPIYQSTSKVGEGENFNVNKLNLYKTNKSIKKGNNIGYYATLVVEIKGQYYFMIQEKNTYFVKASDVKEDNFTSSATYKKYQGMIDKIRDSQGKDLMDFSISAKTNRDATLYGTDSYFEIYKTNSKVKKGKYIEFIDPYIVKYNGAFYLTGGEEFNSDYDPEGAINVEDISDIISTKERYHNNQN